jgi:WD40 repeat protein
MRQRQRGLLLFWLVLLPGLQAPWDLPSSGDRPAAKSQSLHTDLHGDLLPDHAIARLGTLRLRHGTAVIAVGFSADGKSLLSASTSCGVRVWDAETAKELKQFGGPFGREVAVAFSPDGTLAALPVNDRDYEVCEVATGRKLPGLGHDWCRVCSVAFSGDNKILFTADASSTVRIWEVATGKLLDMWVFNTARFPTNEVACTADGKMLVFPLRYDSLVREMINVQDIQRVHRETLVKPRIVVWDTTNAKELRRILVDHPDRDISALVVSPNGKFLAAIVHGVIELWEVESGKHQHQINLLRGGPFSLTFSPDRTLLAVGSGAADITLWDPATGEQVRQLRGHQGWVRSLAFSKDGKQLVSGGDDHTVRLWDVATGKELLPVEGHQAGEVLSQFLSDGKTVVSRCQGIYQLWHAEGAVMRLWDAATGKPLSQLRWDPEPPYSAALAADGRFLALGANDGKITLRDLASGEDRFLLQREPGWVCCWLAFSPDGELLCAHMSEKVERGQVDWEPRQRMDIWNVASAHSCSSLPLPPGMWVRGQFSADGGLLAIVSHWSSRVVGSLGLQRPPKTTLTMWDVRTGRKLRRELPFGHGVWALSASGRVLALTPEADSECILLREVATGQAILTIPVKSQHLRCLAFSPNGRYLAGGTADGSVLVWDMLTGKELGQLIAHRGGTCSISFSRSGNQLLSSGEDSTTLVWDVSGWLKQSSKLSGPRTSKQLIALWGDVKQGNAAQAYQALAGLLESPQGIVPLLKASLRPIPRPDAAKLGQWLEDLNSHRFLVRQQAMGALRDLGEMADPALRTVLAGKPSLEVSRRVDWLLRQIEPQLLSVEQCRALEGLEFLGTVEARQVLESLAQGAPGARLTREAQAALTRLTQRSPPGL